MRKSLFALPFLFVLSASANAVTVINTNSSWDSTTQNHTVGFGNGTFAYLGGTAAATSTYGQTFIAPSDSFLQSYSTKFAFNSGSQFTYKFYIAEWSDTDQDLAAAPVFQSTTLTSFAGPTTTFQDVNVNVNTQLVAGKRYVAFYSTTRENVLTQGSMQLALTDSPAYNNGGFVYSGSDYNTLFTDSWTTNYTANDTVFKATFTAAVPEPGTYAALGLGVAALLRRRRK